MWPGKKCGPPALAKVSSAAMAASRRRKSTWPPSWLAASTVSLCAKAISSRRASRWPPCRSIPCRPSATRRARAQNRCETGVGAQAQVAVRESDKAAALAVVAQRESELDAAQRRLARSETLSKEGASSVQELDDDRARVRSVAAALNAAKAQVTAAQSAIDAARAQVVGSRSAVTAAEATTARIDADLADGQLKAPRDGRVQYRVAQPGEVLGAGGKVLNLVDLSDVYMTFFVPETVAGKLAIGSDVRLILDAAPQYVIPAKVSYVASTAQFTPKTVETASERQKLMFRVKAQIDPALLQKHMKLVKTGLPGVAWVQLDAKTPWPANLEIKVPQ